MIGLLGKEGIQMLQAESIEMEKQYSSGAIQYIKLKEGHKVQFKLSCGLLTAQQELRFYESGEVMAMEPVLGSRVKTFIGIMLPCDVVGNVPFEENGSLQFDKFGIVTYLKSIKSGVIITNKNGERKVICATNELSPIALKLHKKGIEVWDSEKKYYHFAYGDYNVEACSASYCKQILEVSDNSTYSFV